MEAAKKKLSEGLKRNFYWQSREWPYKNVKRCIFAEQYLENVRQGNTMPDKDLLSEKFLCFGGEPRLMYITVKNDDIWEDYYDMDFKKVELRRWWRQSGERFLQPKNWEEMIRISRSLSKDMRFLRVDLYEINGKTYFSECTFYDWAGFSKIQPEKRDCEMGDWIKLPTDKNN